MVYERKNYSYPERPLQKNIRNHPKQFHANNITDDIEDPNCTNKHENQSLTQNLWTISWGTLNNVAKELVDEMTM